jgi:hypothetical protein
MVGVYDHDTSEQAYEHGKQANWWMLQIKLNRQQIRKLQNQFLFLPRKHQKLSLKWEK